MAENVDYEVLDKTLDALAPILHDHGREPKRVAKFVYYLLLIAAGFAEEIGIGKDQFRALADASFQNNKKRSDYN